MYSAYDEKQSKVSINDALSGSVYYYPTCKKRVFVKSGSTRKHAHFCHYRGQSCIDYWKYDESEWSNEWKSHFDKDQVETVYHDHHIDIEVKNNLGIMFQSSSMHRETFIEKTDYMLNNVNNAIWLFNMTENYNNEIIKPGREQIIWRNIWKMFSDYIYSDRKVWIVAEIVKDGIYWYAVLENLAESYEDKRLYVKRWIKREAFIKYFNDIADRKDPEQPYIEEELKQQMIREENARAEQERLRLLKEQEEERVKAEAERIRIEEERSRKEFEEKKKSIDAIILGVHSKEVKHDEEVIVDEKTKSKETSHYKSDYDKGPIIYRDSDMKTMSNTLLMLKRSNNETEFASLANKWYSKYGFAWVRSKYNPDK